MVAGNGGKLPSSAGAMSSVLRKVVGAFGGTAGLFPVLLFATVLVFVSGPGAAHAEIGHAEVAVAATVDGTDHYGTQAGECHPDGHCGATAAILVAPATHGDRLRIANVPTPVDILLHTGLAPGPEHRPPIFGSLA